MMNKIIKKKYFSKKPMYLSYIANIQGVNKYKLELMLNLGNSYFYKKYINLNNINSRCINFANKHSLININLCKDNSTKFNKKRLYVIKNYNENKNFYKKNM